MFNGKLAEVQLFSNTALTLGPSINETSILNLYEFPVLIQYTKGKWQFYSGGQLNSMLDSNEFVRRNRFGDDTYEAAVVFGVRYNVNKNFSVELKYTRNMSSSMTRPIFGSIPQAQNLFQLGFIYKFNMKLIKRNKKQQPQSKYSII
ncbi:MAG: hypothetical protein WA951_13495 [Leeuwenhoekiella sp.]